MTTIAIVGMSARFPGANDLGEFWRNLCDGIESITRFEQRPAGRGARHRAETEDTAYVRARGMLTGIAEFDAGFFGFSPREAQLLDPQHRLFLECSWEALESSGYDPRAYPGLVGVFAGAGASTYLLFNLAPSGELEGSAQAFRAFLHNKPDHLTTRVAYKLNLGGPVVTVQTACSTSLVAVAQACQALATWQCDAALAGGVNVAVPQESGYLHQEGGIGSPDGRCRPFDRAAAGTVPGNGVGAVVLKRLDDALRDGDVVHAVITGWAINNDGGRRVGYTAPAVEGQSQVIAAAHALAGVPPETIGYVEAHGTATAMGDPVEIEALTQAFRRGTSQCGFCAIGSVKGNLGHLDAAAGVAGLVKLALALRYRRIPPSLHYTAPNPHIEFAKTPFYVADRLTEWTANGGPRRGGVSSFGLGGTNAHLVLEEAPERSPSPPAHDHQLLLLSARSSVALEEQTTRLADYLRENPEQGLADIAWTLQAGRARFEHRRMVVARDAQDALSLLEKLDPARVVTRSTIADTRRVIFMFPGQGSQYAGMGRGLYLTEPVFRSALDQCLEMVAPHISYDLRALLEADRGNEETARRLARTEVTQVVLFVLEYALAQLWMSFGIQPGGMVGHSIGELVAATLAGVFSLEDGLLLAAERGRLVSTMAPGAMLSVRLSEQRLRDILPPDLGIAAVNGNESCVVSGDASAIEAFTVQLTAAGFAAHRLSTSHAFHSPMLDPMLEAWHERLRSVSMSDPSVPIASCLTGQWVTPGEMSRPTYWVRHVRETVRFYEALEHPLSDPTSAFLEVGPGRTLRTLVRWHPRKGLGHVALSSLPQAGEALDDRAHLLAAVGQLWLAGVEPVWQSLHPGVTRYRIPLPTYPFERVRYWVDPPDTDVGPRKASLAKHEDVGQWFWVPVWRQAPALRAPGTDTLAPDEPWLVFTDESAIGTALVAELRAANQMVLVVRDGESWRELGPHHFELAAERAEDYELLFRHLANTGMVPRHVVHLWNAEAQKPATSDRGFFSLITIGKLIGRLPNGVDLTVVTEGMQDLIGEEDGPPEQAMILGPVRVIPREYPQVICRSIDVWRAPAGRDGEHRLARQILAETVMPPDEPCVALRGRHRWVQSYQQVRLPHASTTPPLVRNEGVYLVTGGLGGIGLEVAKWLAASAAGVRVVLTSRSSFPHRSDWGAWLDQHTATDPTSRRITALLELETAGAVVMVATADAADESAMRAVVASAVERFGPINGVVHAAGVPSGGLMATRSRSAMIDVLRPKIEGARVLQRVLPEVEFLVLCASRIGVIGRGGQVDYVAANAFLDAFASHFARSSRARVVSIDWGAWSEVGMAAGVNSPAEGTSAARERLAGHPMLAWRILREPGREVYATNFSVDRHWPLDEHRLVGKATMPGVAYFDMVRAALAEWAAGRAITFQEMLFVEPMQLQDNEVREGRLEVVAEGPDEFSFSIWSWERNTPTGRRREHAVGRVTLAASGPAPTVDIAAIARRCPERLALVAEEREDDLGPRWHGVHRVQRGANEVLIELELPEAFEQDWEQWVLHPAILDRAAGLTKRHLVPEHYYLPMLYEGLTIYQPLRGRVFVHGRFRPEAGSDAEETIAFDFNLMTASGETLIRVPRFVQKRLNDPAVHIRGLAAPAESAPAPPAASVGMRPAEGIEALARILASGIEGQVVVSPNDLYAAMAESDSDAALRLVAPAGTGSAKTAAERTAVSTEYVAPSNDVELQVADIWREVLGVERVGGRDSFFELGGDSLTAIQVLSRVRHAFHVELPVDALFQNPTVAGLSEAVLKVLDTRIAEPGDADALPMLASPASG